MIHHATIDSPIGRLTLRTDGSALTGLDLDTSGGAIGADDRRRMHDLQAPPAGVLRLVIRQLEEYFDGTRRVFDVPLAARGTEFQQRVWRALAGIPYGATVSYGALARRLENPGAARAVGRANNRNPIAIIVPCHRVIGADGSLIGYGGGIERKRWLLSHEARQQPQRPSPVGKGRKTFNAL